MKKIALALGVSVMALAAPAIAKDGFYMGLGGIYADNNPSVSHSVAPSSGAGWFADVNRTAINAAPVDNLTTDGYGASVFAGYKTHVAPDFMIAIEADANVFDGKTDLTFTQVYPASPPFAYTIKQGINQDWISTIRGKLGVDIGPGTVYITGGAAFTDVETTILFSDTYTLGNRILSQGGKRSELASGFVWGGGLDMGLGGSTSLRVEYLHHDFGDLKSVSRNLTFNTGLTANNEVLSNKGTLENDIFRVGLAWDLNL